MRLIDANALIEAILEARRSETETVLKLIRLIEAQPTAEPKTGRWIMQRVGEHDEYCVCSECGNQTESDEAWNYCPNCGADMRGEK